MDSALQQVLIGADGSVDPTYVAGMSQAPQLAFSTTALATVLAKCGISGLAITADADEPGLRAWFQALADGGTRGGAGSNVLLTVAKGLLVPVGISAPHGGPATMSMAMHCIYDGTNEPVVPTTGQDLAGTPAVSELFTAGKVMINGVELAGVQSIEVAFGINVLVLGAKGIAWPTYSCIISRTPTITISTLDAAAVSTFGLDGTAQGATDSLVYLRKLDKNGNRVANNVAEHIKFTVDDGLITCRTAGGSHGSPVMSQVVITPTYDGTAAIIVIDTASLIA